ADIVVSACDGRTTTMDLLKGRYLNEEYHRLYNWTIEEPGMVFPGSGYARSGKAGGYAPSAAPEPGGREHGAVAASAASGPALTATSTAAGAGALLVLALGGLTALRNRRRRREGTAGH
ncbi:hypothetical protein ABZ776_33320, partial [Streptomyces sp. NPDC007076]